MDTGFIRDMLDVKILVLYAMNRVAYPVTMQKIFELVFQDDTLSYFDLAQAVPEMVESGHLEQIDTDHYVITDHGRETCSITEDRIAYPVLLRTKEAVDQFNRAIRRSSFVQATVEKIGSKIYLVHMALNDDHGDLLQIELCTSSQKSAHCCAKAFSKKAEVVYHNIIDQLLAETPEGSQEHTLSDSKSVYTSVDKLGKNDYIAHLHLKDAQGDLLRIQLASPSRSHAQSFVKAFSSRVEVMYDYISKELLTILE